MLISCPDRRGAFIWKRPGRPPRTGSQRYSGYWLSGMGDDEGKPEDVLGGSGSDMFFLSSGKHRNSLKLSRIWSLSLFSRVLGCLHESSNNLVEEFSVL